MNYDIRTIVILGITALGIAGAITGRYDVLLATASGLIGFLGKEASTKEVVGVDEENTA